MTFLMLGFSAAIDGLNPTCATFAITPAARQARAIGATVASIVVSTMWNRPFSPAALETSPECAIWPNMARIALPVASSTVGATEEITNSADDQHDRAVEVLALGDLALLARLLLSLRCRFLGLVVLGHFLELLGDVQGV